MQILGVIALVAGPPLGLAALFGAGVFLMPRLNFFPLIAPATFTVAAIMALVGYGMGTINGAAIIRSYEAMTYMGIALMFMTRLTKTGIYLMVLGVLAQLAFNRIDAHLTRLALGS
jgi:hypothetical protein